MEIKKLLKAKPIENTKLLLEEISSIITSPEEAVNFMYSRGYVYSYQTNFNLETDNINGVWATPAHYAYKYNGGGCGATANLFNKLLSNCCNSEGYISFITNGGGHAMNYIKIDNLYYYYDFTNINPKYYGGINLYGSQDVGINNNSLYYLGYITDNPLKFFEEYKKMVYFLNFEDENDDEFVYLAFQYEAIAHDIYPIGFYKDKQILANSKMPLPQILSDKIEDKLIVFRNYLNYQIYFEKEPQPAWPSEITLSREDRAIKLGT